MALRALSDRGTWFPGLSRDPALFRSSLALPMSHALGPLPEKPQTELRGLRYALLPVASGLLPAACLLPIAGRYKHATAK
jgi:hypothetical protein